MNKLLLLATSCLICLTLQSHGAIHALLNERTVLAGFRDSTVKDQLLSSPKEGFKNLFDTETSGGMNITKLNPKAISFVQDYMEENGARLARMKSWGRPYFDLIGEVFSAHGLPVELKYLSVIESDLKSSAVSWAGAVGPWQLMPQTAKDYGLTVTRNRDDRRDYKKSTTAAARYLTDLYNIYNDWLLVVAAYNCGAGNVNSAIRRSGSHNFWDLQYYLPAESRNHVKKFIATHYIMEGEGGLTTITRKEREGLTALAPSADTSLATANISGKYASAAIASVIGMNLSDFNTLNPNFDRAIASLGHYDLRLPPEKMNVFQADKPQILEQSIQLMINGAR
ncbi:MAG: lytic transglycosylase domain-containing protein [Flavisolibacter sp.]